MSDTSKFEQLLDLLVNEEKEKAEELFHDIVVEKSKEIYQGLIESEDKENEDEVEESTEEKEEAVEEATESDDEDEAVEESTDDEDEEVEENFEEESIEEVGGDAADDMINDIEAKGDMDFDKDGEMDDHEEEHGDIEDRVVDLEDALDDLKAEFDAMIADKEGDNGEEGAEDEAEEGDEEPEEESVEAELTSAEMPMEGAKSKSATETMREYVEKVSAPSNSEGADNTKSPVASKGGTEGGANAKNIAQGGEEKGGKAPKAKDMGMSFENEPGSKAGDTFKKASVKKSAE